MLEPEEQKIITKNEIQYPMDKIEPIDPTLKLQEENQNPKIFNPKIFNPKILNNDYQVIKKRLSIELLRQILKDINTPIEQKSSINELIENVRNGDYHLSYSDLNGANQELMRSLNQNTDVLDNPKLIYFHDTLDYDIDLYKIGRKCHGLKSRYAIIKDGKLYSSDKPLKDLQEKDFEKLKEKTNFLKNAEIIEETKDNQSQNGGEWSVKDKNYRIRINYKDEDNKDSSFYLYFDDPVKMKEVSLSIYNLSKSDEYKTNGRNAINNLNNLLIKGKQFYTIFKLLSVKNKIKKRKVMINKIETSVKTKINANLNEEFLNAKVIKSINILNSSLSKEEENPENLRKPKEFKESTFPLPDFMPLITSASTSDKNIPMKRSLNDMVIKFNSTQNIIPKENIEEPKEEILSEEGICFGINNGLKIMNNSGDDIKFNLKQENCDNVKYVFFDKNKPEIIFKNENDDNDNFEQNILNEDNIYEISNIIKNSNNNMNGEEENNLIILGPKLNNDIGINYKYINNDNLYTDPENINIKSKTINQINNKEINGITLQIYHTEININDQKIQDLLKNITGSIIPDINPLNFKDSLLFGYTIKIPPLKKIESFLVKPKQYEQNICFIEYNHQYFIPKEYLETNPIIIIESYCIPLISFSKEEDKIPPEQLGYIGKFLSPVVIGYSKINLKNIREGKYEYEISKDDIPLSNSFILIDGMEEKIESINIKNNIEGKDYSIGSDSYIIKTINKDFIDSIKNNNDIPDDIKNKYFNVCFDTKNEKEFLLRPDENMDENNFFRDISNYIPEEDCEKIKANKDYHYLPHCEKFSNRETLFKSNNFSCLSEEQKEYICSTYNEGDWIYKLPEINVKLLSKNLGVIKDTNQLSQKIYCTEEEHSYPLDSLNNYNKERIIPISENNFNTFDFKELENIDTKNFQWSTGIKFNNQLQMNSFIKLLNLARQNINTKKRSKREYMPFEENKLDEFDKKKKNNLDEINEDEIGEKKLNKCDIGIELIEFIPEYNIEDNHCLLEAKIFIEGLKEKTIISYFEDKNYGFENNLVNTNIFQSKKKQYTSINDDKKIKVVSFNKKGEAKKKEFNEGNKKIYFKDNIAEVDFNRNNNEIKYKLIINFGTDTFSIPLDLNEYLKNKNCTILELPLLKQNEEDIIYGYIEIYFIDKELNNNSSFQELYEEMYKNVLKDPYLLIRENDCLDSPSKNNRFGLYEPNVYRRKILNSVHNNKNIMIDPVNLENYDTDQEQLKDLYHILYKECAVLPTISNFAYFKLFNLRRNNDKEDINNSYRKKLGLRLLKIQKHEKFMKIFRKNKWDLYFKKLSEAKEGIKPYDYFTQIRDKIFLLRKKEDVDNLNKLMYSGVSPEYREAVYSNLLDLPKLYEETRIKISENHHENIRTPRHLYSFFANQLFNDNPKRNIIFSLIDNDSNEIINSQEDSKLVEINTIKKIAKSFIIWSELKIGLDDKDDQYVYFIGLLTLTQLLLKNLKKEYFVFWTLIGLAKNLSHFHQKNPLFSDQLNYINICGLVTKLIMEVHQKKIFDKFISLNIPPELFITCHLSTLFTDYFKGELMMRIIDIIVFESSIQKLYSDNMQYLRVLCAIPLTLYEFSEEQILACKSVSEIESTINDLFLYCFNRNKFIAKLQNNINRFYVVSGFFEKWLFNTQGREWDSKRGELENLIKRHFYPVYEENKMYLLEINYKLKMKSQEIINLLFENLDNKLNSIKSLYLQGTSDYDDSTSSMGINIQISKLKQIYNNENSDINEYILFISFGDTSDKIEQKYEDSKFEISFDNQNNEILNIQDLFYKAEFKNDQCPRYIHFTLFDKNKNNRAKFSYKILNYEPMKISKITLENKDETNKFYLEFILYKYNTKIISADDLSLYNNIFSPPEYYNSTKIEEKLYSYGVSGYYFNKDLTQLIKEQNNNINLLITNDETGIDQNMIEMFKKLNNNSLNEDGYNFERIINKKNNNIFNEKISQKILKIIETCIQPDISNVVKKWLGGTNISLEEILYGIILVDKSIISINEKLLLLFSIGQMRDKLLLNTDDISIDKLKEMIYSLYKRFRIYFTKSDIERMIDFLLKDERLFNIKYCFVHNKNDTGKINEIIYDKDYYEPKIEGDKKIFEIYFDDISKELNIFLNHLSNHYNIHTFSPKIISYIFTTIINSKGTKKYTSNNFDTITLVIEKDNIIYKRIYSIKYSPLKINEEKLSTYYVNALNEDDKSNKILCSELSNIDLSNSYNITNYINFSRFKEVFFKLPYLSDLFRVGLSYLSQDIIIEEKEFSSFKIIVGYEDYTTGIFYFPNNIDEDFEEPIQTKIKYDMKYKVKISDTVDYLISRIINIIEDSKIKTTSDEKSIIEYLNSIDRIKCSVWYDVNGYEAGKIMQENIGYFDTLYSCIALKDKNKAEIHITFNNDMMSLNTDRKPIIKEDGYCKIYYSNNDDFIWKKCRVKRNNMDKSQLISSDYKTVPRILNINEDVVLTNDI